MIKGAIFDLGDTLVTQEPLYGGPACYEGATAIRPFVLEHCLWAPSNEQIAETVGSRLQAAVVQSYESDFAQPDAEAAFVAALQELECELPRVAVPRALDAFFWAHYSSVQLLGEVLPTLTLAKGLGLKLGLVANVLWGSELLMRRLRELGIDRLMSAFVFSCDIGWMKPYPAAYLEVLRRLGVRAAEAVMIGDDPFADVQGAQRAGIAAVWKRDRPGRRPPNGVKPQVVIDDIRQLLPAVAELI